MRGVAANSSKKRARSAGGEAAVAATAAGRLASPQRAQSAVEAGDVRGEDRPGRARRGAADAASRPFEQRDVAAGRERAGAGRRPRRSSVRRGSITTSLVPRALARGHRCAGRAPDGTRRVLRADQHDEVGLLEVLVAAGHDVVAEGAACGRRPREAMQRRELVSMLAEPMKPFISLLAT